MSTSTSEQLLPVPFSPTSQFSKNNSPSPLHPIPYLLRSRSKRPTLQGHLVTPASTSNNCSHLSSSFISTTCSIYLRPFHYDHCPLILLSFLYWILLCTTCMIILVILFQEFFIASSSHGSIPILFSYLVLFPYFPILFRAHPTKIFNIRLSPTSSTSTSLVNPIPSRLIIPHQSYLPTRFQVNFSCPIVFSAVTSSSPYIPRIIASISKSPTREKRILALSNEIQSLISQKGFDTSHFDITTIPLNLIVPSKDIFDIRMNADGSTNKYKTRLVAQGNHQYDSTFFETFADAAFHRSVNVLLSIAASESLILLIIDIKQHFYILQSKKYYISVVYMVWTLQRCLLFLNLKNVDSYFGYESYLTKL